MKAEIVSVENVILDMSDNRNETEDNVRKNNKNIIISNMGKIIPAIVFLVALIGSIVYVTDKMSDRQLGEYRQFEGFYAQDRDTIDVLFAGSSRIHCNVNPETLWEEYGIASYALGLNSQSIDATYYGLKEAFKYQHPKVVMVEVSQFEDGHSRKNTEPSLYGMKYDLNYIEAILERQDFKTGEENLLRFPLYHTRLDMLSKDMLIEDKYPMYPLTGAKGYKGAVEHHFISAFDDYTDEYEEVGELFDAKDDEYLDRIVRLCSQKGAELVFIYTPSVVRTRHIGVEDYMKRHPYVNYINMSDYYDEMDINTHTDFIDKGHMNIYGSAKSSRFLGEYIKANYDVPDHRGDINYYSWDENVIYHNQRIIDEDIVKETGFGNYFNYFPNENYVVIVSLLDGYDSEFIGQLDALSSVGCNEAVYAMGGTWMLDGNEYVYGAFNNTPNSYRGDIGHRSFEITDDEQGLPCYIIDGVDYCVYKDNGNTKVSRGIEVLVYDKLAEKVIDAVCFDADNGWAATRNRSEN